MADYLITYIGHLDILKARAAGLPDQVYDLIFITAQDREGLVNAVNNESVKYIRYQGMSVRRNPFAPEVLNQIDMDRMFIPIHMITHITPEVKLMTGEVPTVDGGTGLASLPSGKELVKQ